MFVLNSTLEKDSIPLLETDLCLVRLVNDRRYPWVLIVPKVADVSELHELSQKDYIEVMKTAHAVGAIMKIGFGADKINTAAIGNMVSQLHIHVVARRQDDATWPGPIWGVGEMEPLTDDAIAHRSTVIRNGMSA